ncbi:MAG TPA: alpha/beta hydrolase family protein [Kofleriaceae bacterium]|nr:alpha/beta hydrolase family protein [Kofleriaceae bacterium]
MHASRRYLVSIALLAGCGRSSGEGAAPAPARPAAPAAHGRVETGRFASASLGVDKAYRIYLPAGYDADPARRWPVFYYLHGLGGTETDWIEHGKLDRAADELDLQAIVVMPDGDDGFYTDAAAPADLAGCRAARDPRHNCVRARAYRRYIVEDLVAHVDATYRTVAAREGRAIAGLSMGGYGALVIGMTRPDRFAAAASHSGVDALLYRGPHPYVEGAPVHEVTDVRAFLAELGDFGALFGGVFGTDIATWRASDPATLAASLAPGALALYLDAGDDDGLLLDDGARHLHAVLLRRGVQHEWFLGPGGHDWDFWAARVPHSLRFLAERVQPRGLPSP